MLRVNPYQHNSRKNLFVIIFLEVSSERVFSASISKTSQKRPLLNFKGVAKVFKYAVWIRINQYQTVNTFIWANNDLEAKMLAEAKYGVGNVLNYTRVDG